MNTRYIWICIRGILIFLLFSKRLPPSYYYIRDLAEDRCRVEGRADYRAAWGARGASNFHSVAQRKRDIGRAAIARRWNMHVRFDVWTCTYRWTAHHSYLPRTGLSSSASTDGQRGGGTRWCEQELFLPILPPFVSYSRSVFEIERILINEVYFVYSFQASELRR